MVIFNYRALDVQTLPRWIYYGVVYEGEYGHNTGHVYAAAAADVNWIGHKLKFRCYDTF